MDTAVLLTGMGIFVARVADVAAGTMRTIATVSGKSVLAFFLGLFEISVWLVVISAVITQIADEPLLGVFYALGFSAGNVVGIKLEQRMAMGNAVVRVISRKDTENMAKHLRDDGFAVTTFGGFGKDGPVTELFLVCRRKDIKKAMAIVRCHDPESFNFTEPASSVNKMFRPMMLQPTGWRAILKKK